MHSDLIMVRVLCVLIFCCRVWGEYKTFTGNQPRRLEAVFSTRQRVIQQEAGPQKRGGLSMSEELPCIDRDKVKIARYPYLYPIPKDSSTYEAALARIMWALNVATLKDIADALGIRESAVSDAKRRGKIPAQWLVRLQLQWNISPLWVLTGYIPPAVPGMPASAEVERLLSLVY